MEPGLNISFQSLDKLSFTCTFKWVEDHDRILGAIISFQYWPSHLNLLEIDFSKFLLWVQVHDLPPNRFNATNAKRIGDLIGNFMSLDET